MPPASGVPPNVVKRFTGASVLHKERVALVPATGCLRSVTETTAVADGQGLTPATVYV